MGSVPREQWLSGNYGRSHWNELRPENSLHQQLRRSRCRQPCVEAMSHPSYAKGYRFEKKVQAWLAHLGKCTRSMMSRGADLTLTWGLREWKVSCKCREKSLCKLIDAELEGNDMVVHGFDRG